MTNPKTITVSKGYKKQTFNLLTNSNRLKSVFYNVGEKFIIDSKDLEEVTKILTRKEIKIKVSKS